MNIDSNQFDNVYNLAASRNVKKSIGRGAPVKMTTAESPEFKKHADEAMKLGNPKVSLLGKAAKFLGLEG